VFHSPQEGQRPCHFGESAPQAEQRWRTRAAAGARWAAER
jgi:hypothetical protein